MPVTKYFARVWSSPKQKEQILFKTDPVLQRPIRIGCCRTSIYVPPVTSYNFNNWTEEDHDEFKRVVEYLAERPGYILCWNH